MGGADELIFGIFSNFFEFFSFPNPLQRSPRQAPADGDAVAPDEFSVVDLVAAAAARPARG
jgi:hypothetical protein